jgi:hypothetical protein
MERRTLIKLAPAALLAAHTPAWGKPSFKTQWQIGAQQGLDACLLMGALSAPSLQAEAYPDDRRYWSARLTAEAFAALGSIRAAVDSQNGLLGPQFALLASAASSETLQSTRQAFANPELIRKGLINTEFWSGEIAWKDTLGLFPYVTIVLTNLENAGFSEYWNLRKRPLIDAKAISLRDELAKLDLIGEQQKYVGRLLDPRIDVYLSGFSEPHGIRIVGQRFLTSYDYPSTIVKRNAAHEIFHPFLLTSHAGSRAILAKLSRDPLLRKIDARPDKSDGYGSIEGLIEEGMVQALEAIVSQKLGFGHSDMGSFWREQDGGIHVFGAAAFDAMRTSGFARHGGDALKWLARAVRRDELTGSKLVNHAQSVVSLEGIKRWVA